MKTNYGDRSNPNARQVVPMAQEFAMLGLGTSVSAGEAMEIPEFPDE